MTGDLAERRHRFRSLYEANYGRILAYARRRTDNPADADDVVAETFLVAWRRLDEARGLEEAWLYAVARKVMSNQRRGAARRQALHRRLKTERHSEHRDETGHEADLVERAFERLNEGDREILGLAYWEELDSKQIGLALGCSSNAARIRLHRARRHLAGELERQVSGQSLTLPTVVPAVSSPLRTEKTR